MKKKKERVIKVKLTKDSLAQRKKVFSALHKIGEALIYGPSAQIHLTPEQRITVLSLAHLAGVATGMDNPPYSKFTTLKYKK